MLFFLIYKLKYFYFLFIYVGGLGYTALKIYKNKCANSNTKA